MTRRGQHGFTLIELLVALTLLGLLSVGLFGGLSLGARTWSAGGERLAEANDAVTVRRFLRHRLQQAKPLSFRDGDTATPVFRGGPHRLRFAASWPAHLGRGGVYVFDLRRAANGPGVDLDWAMFRPGGPQVVAGARERPRRLFTDAESLTFRYYGRRGEGDRLQWHATWRGTTRLPRAIEIRVNGGLDGRWPPLRVRVAGAAGGFGGDGGG
ncbi:type II secretion system protein J (GspJ) [Limimonas halophila]|uniref:Type II secretion system protein J (GspJ) n=1 Tax=Limimonas halophila TaxID=1082479 RepID=A0A1G7UU32_9PROT|nr:prepilin-type N-terminal cleavage/methylation domain-containing protein [Limimonas halophila]SDG51042.1 type II secretion system protein J (GspJ) [Limimonas halophila]